jgi:hypothetical protein
MVIERACMACLITRSAWFYAQKQLALSLFLFPAFS